MGRTLRKHNMLAKTWRKSGQRCPTWAKSCPSSTSLLSNSSNSPPLGALGGRRTEFDLACGQRFVNVGQTELMSGRLSAPGAVLIWNNFEATLDLARFRSPTPYPAPPHTLHHVVVSPPVAPEVVDVRRRFQNVFGVAPTSPEALRRRSSDVPARPPRTFRGPLRSCAWAWRGVGQRWGMWRGGQWACEGWEGCSICEAFDTFDLDKNRFVGAGEIAHILQASPRSAPLAMRVSCGGERSGRKGTLGSSMEPLASKFPGIPEVASDMVSPRAKEGRSGGCRDGTAEGGCAHVATPPRDLFHE